MERKAQLQRLSPLQLMLGGVIFLFLFNPLSLSNLFFLVLACYTLVESLRKRMFFEFDIQLVILVLFAGLYAIMCAYYEFMPVTTAVKYFLIPCVFYLAGKTISYGSEKGLMFFFYTIIIGLTSFGVLSVVYSVIVYGVAGLSYRLSAIPWAGADSVAAATLIGTYLALGISLAGMGVVKSGHKIRILNIVTATAALWCSLLMSNRTGIIIAVAAFAVSFAIQAMLKISIKKNLSYMLISTLVAAIAFGIYDSLSEAAYGGVFSGLFKRLDQYSLASDPRFEAWELAFSGIFDSLVGGKEPFIRIGYAHNMWLDAGWKAGLIPFLLLLAYTLFTISNVIEILRRDFSPYVKLMIATTLTGFVLTFMVEPVLEANLWMFSAFCLFSGMLRWMRDSRLDA